LTGDDRLVKAFQQAMHETMTELEEQVETRVRIKQKDENRLTRNFLYGEFTHFTSRPIKGVPDPHLHAHCFVFNATFDKKEKRIKALDIADLKKQARYYEAAFHARLALHIRELGYAIKRTRFNWEIDGIDSSTLKTFSKRTSQIETLSQTLGVKNPKVKASLGATSRQAKREDIDHTTLQTHWLEQLTDDERGIFDQLHTQALAHRSKATPALLPEVATTKAQVLDHVLSHGFERRSVLIESELKELVLRQGVGLFHPNEVKTAIEHHPEVIKRNRGGVSMYTTHEVAKEERAMIQSMLSGVDRFAPLAPQARFQAGFLSQEQQEAVKHIWNAPDRVIGLRGAAGVGKTTLMQEAVAGIEAAGTQVFTFAPSAQASRGVLRSEGFEQAETLQSLIASENMQKQVKGAVIWIDESGLVSTKQMRQVLDIAKAQGARVVLAGDAKQHASVERGDAFRLLQASGLKVAEVKTIRRQQGFYKEAVQRLSEGDAKNAFELLDRIGSFREVSDADTREKLLVEYYLGYDAGGESALIVSPTHKEGEAITTRLRTQLKARGQLAEDALLFRLKNLNFTEAQKQDVLIYQAGQILEFSHKLAGFKRGDRVRVIGTTPEGQLQVETLTKEQHMLALNQPKFEVFEQQPLPLAPGDRIRITKNGYASSERSQTHRVNNGALHSVKAISDHHIVLENGWRLPKSYGHLNHGYVTTSHSSQGKTVDQVLIAQSAQSFPASSREQFYVSVSRGRRGTTIFTDDKAKLLEAVNLPGERLSAVELLQRKTKQPETKKKVWNQLLQAVRPLSHDELEREPEHDL
ncbi:MAG: AAA family ATPase, partial [Trueperaceae bacterium]|nr:AAA family ATPase [Trueperaceae bacterium]